MYLPIFGLPPSGLTTNKRKMAHALESEPSYCLSQSLNDWRYSREENKSKSSIICMFYFKSMETDARRVNKWKPQGPRMANYSCLAAAQ